jgi:hypothetical protein
MTGGMSAAWAPSLWDCGANQAMIVTVGYDFPDAATCVALRSSRVSSSRTRCLSAIVSSPAAGGEACGLHDLAPPEGHRQMEPPRTCIARSTGRVQPLIRGQSAVCRRISPRPSSHLSASKSCLVRLLRSTFVEGSPLTLPFAAHPRGNRGGSPAGRGLGVPLAQLGVPQGCSAMLPEDHRDFVREGRSPPGLLAVRHDVPCGISLAVP